MSGNAGVDGGTGGLPPTSTSTTSRSASASRSATRRRVQRVSTRALLAGSFLALALAWPSSTGGQPPSPANPDVPGTAFHIVVPSMQAASPPPVRVAPTRPPTEYLRGVASWYSSWCNCTAMRQWRGRRVRVSGPAGSMVVKINDYGPAKWTHRIIDLNPTTFQAVCGPLTKGTCTVRVAPVD